MSVSLCPKELCTGCMACLQKCPKDAIHKREDSGFYYPVIDEYKCVNCGICLKTCPVLNEKCVIGNRHMTTDVCYAIWHKDASIRYNSSSGGFFSALAEYIIKNNGLVFGAAWDSRLVLRHISVSTIHDIELLRRSKYVQSDVGSTYIEVKSALENKRLVLYCGTPCQIAGLKAYLNYKEYDNLLLVDVLCQGVPSPVLFEKYIRDIEDKSNLKIKDVIFRSKEQGWRCGLLLLVVLEDGTILKRKYANNEFYHSFIKEYHMRPACYKCRFKQDDLGYYGDLTIADFWRIGISIPFSDNDWHKGVSAVLVNTQSGASIIEKILGAINIRKRSYKEFSTNGGLRKSNMPIDYNNAINDALLETFDKNQRKYYPFTLRERISHFLQLNLSEKLIRKLRKLM